ncbi:NUDIX hydrolase [Candidatus Parcubacteria bacterium]|nr:NUDIX hydrolase [Candidatus Parcubacteria bacterium]
MNSPWKNFKHAVIAVDMVIFTIKDNELKVLMIKMKKKPFIGSWAVPGGLVKVNESVDGSAKKHLKNKTGVNDVYLEQLYTFGGIHRDPLGRVVSVAYFALIPGKGLKLHTTDEYDNVKWFSVNKLPKLAYDHKEIVKCAVSRLRSKLEYTNIVYSLLSDEFTLSDLQKTYEIILGKKLDKRNFRKKILSLNLIKKTSRKVIGEACRPAILYKFIKKSPQMVKIL